MYVFDTPTSGSQSSFDPNLFAALNNGMGGFGNNGFFWVLILALFWGRGGYGNFGGGQLNSDYGNTLIMNAVQGNRTAISELASSLNCSVGQLQTVLSNIQSQIQSVGAQNNLSFSQTINAIQSGNAGLMSQLQSCCCDIKQSINGVNTGVERGFSALAYENASNFCSVKQAMADNTAKVIAKLDSIEDSRKDREILSLRNQLSQEHQNATFAAMLAPIQKEVSEIKCAQPATVTVPAPTGTLVPACVAWQMGLNGFGPLFNGGGSIWA